MKKVSININCNINTCGKCRFQMLDGDCFKGWCTLYLKPIGVKKQNPMVAYDFERCAKCKENEIK